MDGRDIGLGIRSTEVDVRYEIGIYDDIRTELRSQPFSASIRHRM